MNLNEVLKNIFPCAQDSEIREIIGTELYDKYIEEEKIVGSPADLRLTSTTPSPPPPPPPPPAALPCLALQPQRKSNRKRRPSVKVREVVEPQDLPSSENIETNGKTKGELVRMICELEGRQIIDSFQSRSAVRGDLVLPFPEFQQSSPITLCGNVDQSLDGKTFGEYTLKFRS